MTAAMEAASQMATVIQEDPHGTAVALGNAAIDYADAVVRLDPRAIASLGEFTGQLAVPASGAKALKVAGESIDAARAAMRLGDEFFDAGVMDELEDMSRAAGRAVEPAQVRVNQFDGARRESETLEDLRAQHPNAQIQSQVYLRTEDGRRALDPLTGEGRRLDFVVIEDGRVIDVVETTSMGARKAEQFRKEQRIRAEGGTFIRDRAGRCLLDTCDILTREDRRR
jgi:hypothetical protein